MPQDHNNERIEAFESFQRYSVQRQAEANLESAFQPESPGRAGGVLGCGRNAGRVPGSCGPPAPRSPGSALREGEPRRERLCAEEGMCAAGE